ncbi:hypothetical protein C8J57DRAFT_1215790 [Mycena rebaudengoi]|nr:hypothetical protein C8J57DRAFT_1215790 [Mycena rebaudengoi]
MNECSTLNELLKNHTVAYDEETGRLRMRDGSFIRKAPGENLVEAARRLGAPRIMLGTVDGKAASHAYFKTDPDRAQLIDAYIESAERQAASHAYYRPEPPSARLIETESESDDGNITYQTGLANTDGDQGYQIDRRLKRVYLSVPRTHRLSGVTPEVNSADRTGTEYAYCSEASFRWRACPQ